MSKLYAINVTNAKPRDRDYKLANGKGLYLLVKANGTKTWRMNFRLDGGQRTVTFGKWPAIGLAEARERREAARRLIALGIDPILDERRIKTEAKIADANTFRAVAEEWSRRTSVRGAPR